MQLLLKCKMSCPTLYQHKRVFFVKKSILDVWQGSEYTCNNIYKNINDSNDRWCYNSILI